MIFNPCTLPEGTVLIEIRGIYDGWSVAQLPDGRLLNRWSEHHRLHKSVQDWIDNYDKGDEE